MPQPPPPPPTAPRPPLRHSGPGIASFIISLSSFVLDIGAMLFFTVIDHRLTLSPSCTCGFPTGLAGIIVGLVGLFLPNRKKLFAYLGITISALILALNGIFIAKGWIN